MQLSVRCKICHSISVHIACFFSHSLPMTLLVGRQEVHPTCKKYFFISPQSTMEFSVGPGLTSSNLKKAGLVKHDWKENNSRNIIACFCCVNLIMEITLLLD